MQQRLKIQKAKKGKSTNDGDYSSDEEFNNELLGKPYMPPTSGRRRLLTPREANPVVFLEISAMGGRKLLDGAITPPRSIGRMYFELRNDLVPVACSNFMALVSGARGRSSSDGILYHYKGTRIHRVTKDLMLQGGDLLDQRGNCSRSIFANGSLFRDENYIFRHTGAGCISYCNRGPDTNGSLFQIVFRENKDLDEKYVVFGCLASIESYDVLGEINSQFGTETGEPMEELRISNCGIAFPDPNPKKDKSKVRAKPTSQRETT